MIRKKGRKRLKISPFPCRSKNRSTVEKHRVYEEVRQRDDEACIFCGAYVQPGTPAHHEPPRSHGGQDIPENLVTFCLKCHNARHFGKHPQVYQEKAVKHLQKLYFWDVT